MKYEIHRLLDWPTDRAGDHTPLEYLSSKQRLRRAIREAKRTTKFKLIDEHFDLDETAVTILCSVADQLVVSAGEVLCLGATHPSMVVGIDTGVSVRVTWRADTLELGPRWYINQTQAKGLELRATGPGNALVVNHAYRHLIGDPFPEQCASVTAAVVASAPKPPEYLPLVGLGNRSRGESGICEVPDSSQPVGTIVPQPTTA